ncbi:MAG: molybdenum cofactor guanylyltransferase MobA [Rhodobacteraceae bacterium]|nr:molybdenum cofactor guanylyltransferase MobA [Paracoccaceae bacterium]
MVRPLGVILAGGLARRMGGGDKSLLSLGASSRVLDQVIARLGAQVDQMVLNANGDPERFDEFGLPVVADSLDGFLGPLAGVLAGLDYAADHGFDHIVSVAADTPFFPTDLVSALETASKHMDVPIALAATKIEGGKTVRHPTFGLWHVALREDLRSALQDGLRKVVLWTDQHGAETHVFDSGEIDPFFNINTPEDLELANKMMETLS